MKRLRLLFVLSAVLFWRLAGFHAMAKAPTMPSTAWGKSCEWSAGTGCGELVGDYDTIAALPSPLRDVALGIGTARYLGCVEQEKRACLDGHEPGDRRFIDPSQARWQGYWDWDRD